MKFALLLAAGLLALAAQPAFAADDPNAVIIPWGQWVAAIATAAAPVATVFLGYLVRTFAPAMSAFATDAAITQAVHYALASVDGAIAGRSLSLSASNEVARVALQWLIDNEPALWARLGPKLGDMILAKISAVGAAPSTAMKAPPPPVPARASVTTAQA